MQSFDQQQLNVEALLEDDSVYEYHATPLKSAAAFKQEHLRAIKNFLQFEELTEHIQKTEELLPTLMSAEQYSKIHAEIENCGSHSVQFLETLEGERGERPLLLQEIFGFSDQTLLVIYPLAVSLMQEHRFSDALALLCFLSTLAPHVESYWIAEAICLQELNRHEEALTLFDVVKTLNEMNPAPYAYSMASYASLKEEGKAKEALQKLQFILKTYEGSDKENFMAFI